MLPTEGGELFFKKMDKSMKERVCRALKAQQKQQMACEFHKIASAMHTMLFADWALEAKMHKSWAIVIILMGSWSEKKLNRANKGARRTAK